MTYKDRWYGTTSLRDTPRHRNPKEFMDYNCNYSGAKEWVAKAQPAVV